MQPLGEKNHATSWYKKNHTTSWDKKCTKNSNLSHKQNSGDRHRSPWSCLFLDQSNKLFISAPMNSYTQCQEAPAPTISDLTYGPVLASITVRVEELHELSKDLIFEKIF